MRRAFLIVALLILISGLALIALGLFSSCATGNSSSGSGSVVPETGATAGSCTLDLHYINDLPGLTGTLDRTDDVDPNIPGLQVSFGAEVYGASEAQVTLFALGQDWPTTRQPWAPARPLYVGVIPIPEGTTDFWLDARAPGCQSSSFLFNVVQ